MLALNRRIGETLCIGDDISVTVYDMLRYHVTLGVVAPPTVPVALHGAPLQPAVLEDGSRFYLLSIVRRDAFCVGEVGIRVDFRHKFLHGGAMRARPVRFLIDAPRSVVVDREEVHLRKRAAAGDASSIVPSIASKSAWLHRANRAVSSRMAA